MNLRLRTLRKSNGFTQQEVANKIGKSKQWVSELERGNIGLSYEMSVKIASVYGKTPDIFLDDKSI